MLTGDVSSPVSGVKMSTLITDDFETIPVPSVWSHKVEFASQKETYFITISS